jgi:hypothetical protein
MINAKFEHISAMNATIFENDRGQAAPGLPPFAGAIAGMTARRAWETTVIRAGCLF